MRWSSRWRCRPDGLEVWIWLLFCNCFFLRFAWIQFYRFSLFILRFPFIFYKFDLSILRIHIMHHWSCSKMSVSQNKYFFQRILIIFHVSYLDPFLLSSWSKIRSRIFCFWWAPICEVLLIADPFIPLHRIFHWFWGEQIPFVQRFMKGIFVLQLLMDHFCEH